MAGRGHFILIIIRPRIVFLSSAVFLSAQFLFIAFTFCCQCACHGSVYTTKQSAAQQKKFTTQRCSKYEFCIRLIISSKLLQSTATHTHTRAFAIFSRPTSERGLPSRLSRHSFYPNSNNRKHPVNWILHIEFCTSPYMRFVSILDVCLCVCSLNK